MLLGRAITRMTGTWTPGPDPTLHEGEEGVGVEVDTLTEVEEVAVRERRNIHKDSRFRNGAVPTTTHPVRRLRAVSFTHMVINRPTEVVQENGITAGP